VSCAVIVTVVALCECCYIAYAVWMLSRGIENSRFGIVDSQYLCGSQTGVVC